MSSIWDKIKIVRLEEDTLISSFDCGDIDLNDFLYNDSKNYLKSMLAVTYLIKVENEIAAYFCLSYDGLTRTTILTAEEKALWNKVGRKIPNSKRRKTYPAVKIGRLAVNQKFSGLGLGTQMLLSVREMYLSEPHHAGCRFVTVDAYRSALPFYERNDFRYLTTKDEDEDTRAMYFDLKSVYEKFVGLVINLQNEAERELEKLMKIRGHKLTIKKLEKMEDKLPCFGWFIFEEEDFIKTSSIQPKPTPNPIQAMISFPNYEKNREDGLITQNKGIIDAFSYE